MKTFKEFLNEATDQIAKLVDSIAKEMGVDRNLIGACRDVGTIVKFEITSGPKKGSYIADINDAGTMVKKGTVEKA